MISSGLSNSDTTGSL